MNKFPVYWAHDDPVGEIVLTDDAVDKLLSVLPDISVSVEYTMNTEGTKRMLGLRFIVKPSMPGNMLATSMATVKMEQPIYNFAAVTKDQLKAIVREVLEEEK